jgi:hypothetical protein
MAGIVKTSIILFVGAGIGAGAALMWTHSQPDIKSAITIPAEARTSDGRLAIYLSPDEQDHISAEMLDFLRGVQTITYGFAEQDRALIGETAAHLSKGAGDPIGRSIRQKVPTSFRQLSQELRGEFGTLADMSANAPLNDLQYQFSNTTSRCAACHGSYSVVETSSKP